MNNPSTLLPLKVPLTLFSLDQPSLFVPSLGQILLDKLIKICRGQHTYTGTSSTEYWIPPREGYQSTSSSAKGHGWESRRSVPTCFSTSKVITWSVVFVLLNFWEEWTARRRIVLRSSKIWFYRPSTERWPNFWRWRDSTIMKQNTVWISKCNRNGKTSFTKSSNTTQKYLIRRRTCL